MNNRAALFAQAVRGPILLITVGILFAIHQAGILPFSRTWPLVVIVVGVMKLLERLYVNRATIPPGGPRL
jgi:cell wall-active antibiotic response 4TMS protein YvqF